MPDKLRNHDVDWDQWPVGDYLDEIYRKLHPSDDMIIQHHSEFYRGLAPDSIDVSLELGSGPNLYPLMVTAAVSRRIEVVEPSTASLAYLHQQLTDGPDATWLPFYERCRQLQPALPETLTEALSRVAFTKGQAADLPTERYGLASMHFVAESCTEDFDEFREVCRAFVRAVRRGGYLVAAFMENMGRYQIGDGPQWPGYKVDTTTVDRVLAPLVSELAVSRIDFDTTGPDYGYSGMIMVTATR